jgi:hypothetical protein
MFVLGQRAPISNTSSIASRQLTIMIDDKIRVNKPNIYHEDRIGLED